ncbi:MAG TPA: ferric reductase-like transmembrane domain-containing protein [Dehalococcoidia bacterium]|nr:ferric reductase-like transmembrane domain-containing protein [Dehalococcoidia bacterium]
MSYDMTVWEIIRASGLVAYGLLTISVAVGIAIRLRALDWFMQRAWVLESHATVSVLALAFTGVHMLTLLLNRHVPFTPAGIFIPFASSWDPPAVAVGIVATYLAALLVVTSYVRPYIGYKTWRAVHYGGFAAWAMALGHSIGAGSDTGDVWVRYFYLASAVIVILLTLGRVFQASAPRPEGVRSAVGREPVGAE